MSLMSRNNDADIDGVPDEPPPPYEPLGAAGGQTNTSTNHAAAATTNNTAASTTSTSTGTSTNAISTASHNPFLAPEEQSTPNPESNTNPFLSAVTAQQTDASPTPTVTSSGPAPATNSQVPSLPPRNYAAPQSSAPSQQEPSRPSLDSRHSRASSILPPTSPSPASPSVYAPPTGPPPPPPSSSSPSSSSANRPDHRRTDSYRPTTVPTPGQPLLRKGKLLVYPRDWRGCIKCNDTGYKHGDPNNPHKSCWDKYGKTYTSAMSYSVGLNGATNHFQKPLPFVSGPPMGAVPPVRPSHGYMPGGYPGAVATGYNGPSPAPVPQGYAGYGPPIHAPPPHAPPPSSTYRPPRTPTTPSLDAETEGARMSDVPPNYQDASNVDSHERLPSQYVPPPVPPPGHAPARPPSQPHHAPYPPPPPNGFVGGFTPNPGGPNPCVAVQPLHQPWYGARPPPPNALVVMPGDPRIGGRLCFECGGRGVIESFWLGDETCFRCRGAGRVF